MEKQLDFNLPAIERDLTKKAVEAALEKYHIFQLSQSFEGQPKITQTYSIVSPSNTNKFHSSTEEIAVKNVDLERERSEYIKKFLIAVNRLAHWERAIIIKRYMQTEDVYDYEVYNELGFSERKYYRLKSRAFYKLAFALKIEVYMEGKVV